MSDYLCPYRCSYRTNAGYCGYTGGYEACQYRRIIGFDYESKQFCAEPVKTPEERYVWPPKTNGDMIRAMTDEELAEWLEQFASCELCPAIRERCGYGDGCVKAWFDWLKQKMEE